MFHYTAHGELNGANHTVVFETDNGIPLVALYRASNDGTFPEGFAFTGGFVCRVVVS